LAGAGGQPLEEGPRLSRERRVVDADRSRGLNVVGDLVEDDETATGGLQEPVDVLATGGDAVGVEVADQLVAGLAGELPRQVAPHRLHRDARLDLYGAHADLIPVEGGDRHARRHLPAALEPVRAQGGVVEARLPVL